MLVPPPPAHGERAGQRDLDLPVGVGAQELQILHLHRRRLRRNRPAMGGGRGPGQNRQRALPEPRVINGARNCRGRARRARWRSGWNSYRAGSRHRSGCRDPPVPDRGWPDERSNRPLRPAFRKTARGCATALWHGCGAGTGLAAFRRRSQPVGLAVGADREVGNSMGYPLGDAGGAGPAPCGVRRNRFCFHPGLLEDGSRGWLPARGAAFPRHGPSNCPCHLRILPATMTVSNIGGWSISVTTGPGAWLTAPTLIAWRRAG